MPSFNQVILIGHLTRDPQLKHLPGGTSVVELGIASNRKYKTASGEEREDVLFIDAVCFGKRGEVINQYFTKGKPIFIVGRLKLDQWERDGQKRSKHSVIVEEFQFIGGNAGGGDSDQREPARHAPSQRPGQTVATDPAFAEPQMDADDLPF